MRRGTPPSESAPASHTGCGWTEGQTLEGGVEKGGTGRQGCEIDMESKRYKDYRGGTTDCIGILRYYCSQMP